MKIEDVLHFYSAQPIVQDICSTIQVESNAQIVLEGIVGSSQAILGTVIGNATNRCQLFLFHDKENAAYHFNDLESLTNSKRSLFFPASYKRPYQVESYTNANVQSRVNAMSAVQKNSHNKLLTSFAEAISEKVVSRQKFRKQSFVLKKGEIIDLDVLIDKMHEFDFERTDFVTDAGQFSIRGNIFDVFSFGSSVPHRIEFMDDMIEGIRPFEVSDQLTTGKLDRLEVLPSFTHTVDEESYQHLIDFLPDESIIWIDDLELLCQKINEEMKVASEAFDALGDTIEHLPPASLYLSEDELLKILEQRTVIYLNRSNPVGLKKYSFSMEPQPAINKNFELLQEDLAEKAKQGYEHLITFQNSGQMSRLYEIFEDTQSEIGLKSLVISLHNGFVDKQHKFLIYTDHQLFNRYHKFQLKSGFHRKKEAITLKELKGLTPGDFITHIDHGVGCYSGLEKIDVNGKKQEAIRILYKNNDVLYVSIHSLHRISKYIGKDGAEPKLDKIGSSSWKSLKKKTKARVKEIAFDLIKLYAKRKSTKGFQFSPDTYLQNELEASFLYEDTEDQVKATHAVKKDMEAEYPMDRLICGDVGFGKTEIALRAAFKAVSDSKQVAILVPTTILALQHYQTFKKRFEGFPCTVDYLNRFKTAGQQKDSIRKLKEGKVDIIIGTHRLVSKDVEFKDLGLLIIDEEQKFGVGVKDKLKTMKENVDTLTLTATPIPRTLQFSLMNARDLSIINTAPPNRQSIETSVRSFNEDIIRDAIDYELQRRGQVFFINNRIENITEVAGMIQRLCPEARVLVGHGQMKGDVLEKKMMDFIQGAYDVLVSTTIVESGLDIPNANTIIINQANHFGLSDLHQMRGRVGRSNRKAFCYLLAPPKHTLSTDARKRLNAIEQYSELGSGFQIAMRDLDIRGAGNLLGAEQTGFISEIGFDMYQKILNEAINELKENEFKDLYKDEQKQYAVNDCSIETDLEILIPDSYVSSINERLSLYREIDEIENGEELSQFEWKLTDRFGPLPEATKSLIDTIKLRWMAKKIGFEKMLLKQEKMIGYFPENEESPYFQSPEFSSVLSFVQQFPNQVKLKEKNQKLQLQFGQTIDVKSALLKMEPLIDRIEKNPVPNSQIVN